MWNKKEPTQPQATPAQAPQARQQQASRASVIGPSLHIKGDLTGNEDLVIQGTVEGEVKLNANNVTVGKEGRIRADIYGRTVHVEGQVKGHLFGKQEVVIRASGKVQGDIVSPRVILENGSNFKGSIDMEPATASAEGEKAAAAGQGAGEPAKKQEAEKAKPAQASLSGTAQGGPSTQPEKAKADVKKAVASAASGAGNRS